MAKTPREYARWVCDFHGLETTGFKPIDLEELLQRCGGFLGEIELSDSAGVLVPVEGGFGILLQSTDSARRKRFTIAHELGHFCIPTHLRGAISCVSPETGRNGSGSAIEREANEFAVELLMPQTAISQTLKFGSVNLARSNEISEAFDVSLVSAALRVSELTREPTAVIYSEDGIIRWGIRHGFPYGIPDRGTAFPLGTVAYDLINGGSGSDSGEEVEPSLWLPLAREHGGSRTVIESSRALGERGGMITMLWSPTTD